MSAILNSNMADSRNLYFVLIFLILFMPDMIIFLCLFLEMLFSFQNLLFGKIIVF